MGDTAATPQVKGAESDTDEMRTGVDGGWVPVVIVRMQGEGGWLAVDVSTKEQFAGLHDELVDGWTPPPSNPSLTVDPGSWAPPFTIEFSVMTRGQLDRLPEFGGW